MRKRNSSLVYFIYKLVAKPALTILDPGSRIVDFCLHKNFHIPFILLLSHENFECWEKSETGVSSHFLHLLRVHWHWFWSSLWSYCSPYWYVISHSLYFSLKLYIASFHMYSKSFTKVILVHFKMDAFQWMGMVPPSCFWRGVQPFCLQDMNSWQGTYYCLILNFSFIHISNITSPTSGYAKIFSIIVFLVFFT